MRRSSKNATRSWYEVIERGAPVSQNDLLKFLWTARDLEASYALLAKAEAEAISWIRNLSSRETPAFEPPHDNIPEKAAESFRGGVGAFAAIGFVVGVVFCIATEMDMIDSVENPISKFLYTILFIIGAVIYGAIGAVIGAIPGSLVGNMLTSKKRERLEAENEEALTRWKAENEAFKARIAATVQEFRSAAEAMGELKSIVERMRESHYEDGPVYRKYQTLPAICQLCEYFESGRFTELGSAYNQYELEVRLDRIVDRLDEALASLNQIITNQRVLYDVLVDMSSKLGEINQSMTRCAQELERSARLQEVSAVCLQQTALATTLLSQIAYYKNRHNLPFALDVFEGALVGINAKLLLQERKKSRSSEK